MLSGIVLLYVLSPQICSVFNMFVLKEPDFYTIKTILSLFLVRKTGQSISRKRKMWHINAINDHIFASLALTSLEIYSVSTTTQKALGNTLPMKITIA